MKPVIYPYKMGSISAHLLAKRLGCKRVYPVGKYVPEQTHLIVNWGNSTIPNWGFLATGLVLNTPQACAIAGNKLAALNTLFDADVLVPNFTINRDVAAQMLKETRRVYCRTVLRGHSGNGIVVATKPSELVDAPLYTAGVCGKRDEYRVHVFNGKVIDFQKKRRKKSVSVDTVVRNHRSGWIYAREGVTLSDEVREISLNAIGALGLDFGGVDVICKREDANNPFVLEVNTACGLEGVTLESYAQAIEEMCGV